MVNLEKFMRDTQGGYATFHIPTGGGFSDIECSFSEEDSDKPNTPLVHCHVGLGDEKGLKGYVAHLKEATVRLTAEIKIEVYKEKIFRKIDKRVNLNLLDLPSDPAKRIKETNIKGGYDKYDLEVAIIREALNIWDGKGYNANNIKNLLSNNSPERTNDVDTILERLKDKLLQKTDKLLEEERAEKTKLKVEPEEKSEILRRNDQRFENEAKAREELRRLYLDNKSPTLFT
ncbi:15820_t:CDS:2 [Funneliformis geosporum]|nr:15820_t:CDS:2 [Funneliformis geosporum]